MKELNHWVQFFNKIHQLHHLISLVIVIWNCFIHFYLGNKIGDEGAQSLSSVLQQNTSITSLNLSGNSHLKLIIDFYLVNKIGDEGAQSLSSFLQQNTSITSLDLSSNSHLKLFYSFLFSEWYWRWRSSIIEFSSSTKYINYITCSLS